MNLTFIDCMNKQERIEVRRVQALQGERSFVLVFPKDFATELGVRKGDFLKCFVDGNRLIVEKRETCK
jgi:antitoxin component of MazEF toxin-antitoxin module